MSYDPVVGALGGDDASSGVAITVGGSSYGSGIRTSIGVVFSAGAIDAEDARRSG